MNAPQTPQPDGHQQMAMKIHQIFSQGQGVPVSSAQAEQVVEMKLWLAAIANGQLKILDTAAPPTPPTPPTSPTPPPPAPLKSPDDNDDEGAPPPDDELPPH